MRERGWFLRGLLFFAARNWFVFAFAGLGVACIRGADEVVVAHLQLRRALAAVALVAECTRVVVIAPGRVGSIGVDARAGLVVACVQRTHVHILTRVVAGAGARAVFAQVQLRAAVAVVAFDVGQRNRRATGLLVACVVGTRIAVVADALNADAFAQRRALVAHRACVAVRTLSTVNDRHLAGAGPRVAKLRRTRVVIVAVLFEQAARALAVLARVAHRTSVAIFALDVGLRRRGATGLCIASVGRARISVVTQQPLADTLLRAAFRHT